MNLIPALIVTLFVTASFFSANIVAQSKSPQEQDQAMDKGKMVKTPERGITMAKVKREFGTAKSENPSVGEPPITRWEYEGFTVYFEHDRVITSVFNEQVSEQGGK